VKTEIIRVKIPDELLIVPELEKPVINSANDAANAYIDLFFYADDLKIKLKSIKKLNDFNATATE
jgi:hypothetical protein